MIKFEPLIVRVTDGPKRYVIKRMGTGDWGGGVYACNCPEGKKSRKCKHIRMFFDWKDSYYKHWRGKDETAV